MTRHRTSNFDCNSFSDKAEFLQAIAVFNVDFDRGFFFHYPICSLSLRHAYLLLPVTVSI